MAGKQGLFNDFFGLLKEDYRGVNIAVYALATAGLAASIHRIRPVSKFSKASKIPDHFLKNHVPLRGVFAGVQHSPVRVLVNHKAPIYLPLWHSSKPPLPVKLWGVEVISNNAVSWLNCVAKDKNITLKPIARDNEDLVSHVMLHLPKQNKRPAEAIDLGQKLLELGFAKALVPKNVDKGTLEGQLASRLLSAETRARNYRNGIWLDILPPKPWYEVVPVKAALALKEVTLLSLRSLLWLIVNVSKSTLTGAKYVVMQIKTSRTQKPVQTST